jgi:phosphatidylserine/phosphatidylglycerophosphate/cardiolipin synthase-like enzyme
MDLSDAVEYLDVLAEYDLSPAEVGYSILYIDASTGALTTEEIMRLLEVPEDVAETILVVFSRTGGVHRINGQYEVSPPAIQQTVRTLSWLTNDENITYHNRLRSDSYSTVTPLINFPGDHADFKNSTLTGTLIDLLAETDKRATVIVPFFSDHGMQLLSDALVAVTDRGGTLEILTRDIIMGSEGNKDYIEQLYQKLDSEGAPSQCNIYELDQKQYPRATLHAKSILSDESRAYIGSANFTKQSLLHAFEMGLLVTGSGVRDCTETVDKIIESDLMVSQSWKLIL